MPNIQGEYWLVALCGDDFTLIRPDVIYGGHLA